MSRISRDDDRRHVAAARRLAGDFGEWQAIAANNPKCHTKRIGFRVTGLPATDAAAAAEQGNPQLLAFAALLGGCCGLAMVRRRDARQPV